MLFNGFYYLTLFCCLSYLALSQPSPLDITFNIIDTPDSQDYPQRAQAAVTAWDPFIYQFLNGQEVNPPRSITFQFQKGLPAPALTSGSTISVNVDYINSNPDDIGMMIHQYTYIIEQYPGNQLGYDDGWVSSGIADYIRYIYYEVQPDNPTNPTPSDSWFAANEPQTTATYKSGYGNAARFLFWISQNYNIPDLVPKINEIQRQGQYQPSVFSDLTGTSISDMWTAYAAQLGVPNLKAPVEIAIQIVDNPDGDAQAFPQKARDIVEAWDPFITQFLASDGFIPSRTATFTFQKGLSYPAYTVGTTISVNVDWINPHPGDLGMMIHEYTHVVQQYSGNQFGYDAGWLTEGIADYIRYIYYEVQPDNPTNPTMSDSWFVANQPQPTDTYKSGYGNAARFLYWVSQTYNIPDLVTQLNAIQRQGQFQPSVFNDLTGTSISDLWNTYAAGLGVPNLTAPQDP